MSHKVTNYLVFNVVLMISIFMGILLTYLNVLNILTFILKCFTYVYARYVLSQLYTVLIIPNDYSFMAANHAFQAQANASSSTTQANFNQHFSNDNFEDGSIQPLIANQGIFPRISDEEQAPFQPRDLSRGDGYS
mmetsp:Transcript_3382/g.5691  ORF Transcript_3382/g.5691 Transcript_3382/m.5691 type:complete len:135 (-) Transcript_3382:219-623(-)